MRTNGASDVPVETRGLAGASGSVTDGEWN